MKTPKTVAPPINRYDYDAINSVVDGVDACARKYEDKWGVGRLELLVSDELREKFRRQMERFNDAISKHDVVKVRISGAATHRAWQALDKAAEDTGQKPLEPEVWELAMPGGRVIVFCRHIHDSYAAYRNGRDIEVWTPDEIIRLIDKYPDIVLAKQTFPGAYVQAVRAKSIPNELAESESDIVYADEAEAEEL